MSAAVRTLCRRCAGRDPWLIGVLIDYDSCFCLLRFRPSVSATAGSSFVNIRAHVWVKLLCILSGQQLAGHISSSWKHGASLSCRVTQINTRWAAASSLNYCQRDQCVILILNILDIITPKSCQTSDKQGRRKSFIPSQQWQFETQFRPVSEVLSGSLFFYRTLHYFF